MKRQGLLFSAFLLVGMLFSTQMMGQARIILNGARSTQECLNATDDGFTATFSFNSINATEVATERGVFSNITMDGTYPAGNIGDPTLPAANKLIAVPFGAQNVSVEVKNYTTTVYNLADYGIHNLYPQQIPLRKDQKPEEIPFSYNAKAYAQKGFVERPIAQVEIQGTLRGIQIGALTVNPVQYDAANNLVRVFNNIEVEVSFGKYDKTAAYNEFARTFSPYFANLYKDMFNSRAINDVYDDHPDLWQNPVKMLVITHRMFENTIQDWVAWKTTKGFYVDVNYTDQIGTNASAIRTFIQGKYAEDAPTFLMIMGDKDQIPASATGSASQCVTDLSYSSVDGDEFPDMYHSRFPAETVAQMESMLNKALEYEQYTMPDPSYLNNVLLIAGEDSSGWGVQVGRPTIWYATNYYYNPDHGYDQVHEFSHGTYTGCYSWLNVGVGFANYTAHGSNTSWAGPSFTVSDVNNLTNEHKYFLAMGNCCEAADWGINGTCFGEAMVRANNKGAFAYIGSCPSTYWKNDYYFGVGATNHANGTMPTMEETTMGFYDAMWTDDAYNTVTSMMFIGNLASNAAQALGYELHISTLYCWQAYHTLGDGSIMPFRVQPTENTISHLPTMPIGMDFYTVEADPGSYVGISKDGVLCGAGMIGESGSADIAIEPITSGGDVTICVTHPQRIPSVETVPAAAMTGAYVALDAYSMNVEQANYGDTIDMSINVKNVGTQAASNLTATLTTECEFVEILSGEGTVTSINPDEVATMEGFQFSVAEDVPDNTKALFYLDVTDGTDTWQSKINITLHAPGLALEAIQQSEGGHDGPVLTFTFKNTGSAPFYGGTLNVFSSSTEVTFEQSTIVFDNEVAGGETVNIEVSYAIDSTAAVGSTYEVAYELTTGLLSNSGTYVLANGVISEGFESGQLGPNWTQVTNYPWTVVSTGAHEGNYCAKSTNEGVHSSESYMEMSVNVLADGNLSFFYKVSSEQNYDKLHFYMDGQEKGVWSGQGEWTEFIQPVTVGNHTFRWSYTKDSSVSSNSDCAYVDDINFPPTSITSFIAPVTDLTATVNDGLVTLSWTPSDRASSYIITRDGEEIDRITETVFEETVTEGTYEYGVIAADDNGALSVPTTIVVEVIITSVNENSTAFEVYPNPVSNTLYVKGVNAKYDYAVFNNVGQEMMRGNAQGTLQINVSSLSKGVYFLRLTSGSQTNVQKIIVE